MPTSLRFFPAAVLLAAALLTTPAAAQLDDPSARKTLTGIVLGTILTVDAQDVPARAFFASLEAALGWPIRGTWSDDAYGHGLDPKLPITVRIENADALFVIELALEQLATWEPCTWQFSAGGIEVGTKERLSERAITRLYPLADFMIEPPRYSTIPGTEGTVEPFYDNPYHTASLTRPAEHRFALRLPNGQIATEARKTPRQLLNEMMQAIVSFIEPGNWAAPARTEPGEVADDVPPTRRRIAHVRASPTGHGMIVKAPDFVHRQIDGLPVPAWPRTADAGRRAERTARASAPGISIEVVHVGAPPRRTEIAP